MKPSPTDPSSSPFWRAFAVACLVLAALFAVLLWPTPYLYVPSQGVRINRITGCVQRVNTGTGTSGSNGTLGSIYQKYGFEPSGRPVNSDAAWVPVNCLGR